jgi:hypothetical protein
MSRRWRLTWLPPLLFRFTLLVGVILLGLVALSPLVDPPDERPRGWWKLVAVFARDATLRRTAVASAVGLAVTAFVFFRQASRPRPEAVHHPRLPPPTDVVGA